MAEQSFLCSRCNLIMEKLPNKLEYLGNRFDVELPQCPNCGTVYLDEALVNGRIAEVEALLESK